VVAAAHQQVKKKKKKNYEEYISSQKLLSLSLPMIYAAFLPVLHTTKILRGSTWRGKKNL
jgi:hypothetical protein